MRAAACCAIVLLTINYVSALDCSVSKEFNVNGLQTVAGVLKDSANLPIPGLLLEVLQDHAVVRQLRTDDDGRFDLGRIVQGKYRLRIVSQPFCAPRIRCLGQDCTVVGTLRIDEKRAKPVTVY